MRELVAALDLQPHPEGGWFRETWRAPETVPTPRGPRAAGTSILYLLADGSVSRLHRLAFAEVWHLHAGGPLRLHLLGRPAPLVLTADPAAPRFQAVVEAGTWFGAETGDGWALVGCTMAPGFASDDFELGRRSRLEAEFPDQADLVRRLTPPDAGSAAAKETP